MILSKFRILATKFFGIETIPVPNDEVSNKSGSRKFLIHPQQLWLYKAPEQLR